MDTKQELINHYGKLYMNQCARRRATYKYGEKQQPLTEEQQRQRKYNQDYYQRNKERINKRVQSYNKEFYYYGKLGKTQMQMKPLFDWYIYTDVQREIDRVYRKELRARHKIKPLFHDI